MSRTKNDSNIDGTLYKEPMERLAFAIKDISGEAYLQLSNADIRVLLKFKIFGCFCYSRCNN